MKVDEWVKRLAEVKGELERVEAHETGLERGEGEDEEEEEGSEEEESGEEGDDDDDDDDESKTEVPNTPATVRAKKFKRSR